MVTAFNARDCVRFAQRFRRDDSGTIIFIFALALVPIIGGALSVIDYTRAMSIRGEFQRTIDGAADVAAQRIGSDDSQAAHKTFAAYYTANIEKNLSQTPYQIKVDDERKSVTASVRYSHKTSFARLFGFESIDLNAKTVAYQRELVPAALPSPEKAKKKAKETIKDLRQMSRSDLKSRIIIEINQKLRENQRAGKPTGNPSPKQIEQLAETLVNRIR